MTVEWVRPPVRVLVLGRPGSGKGTQGTRLAGVLDVPHISTGDLLRSEIAGDGPLGREVAAHVHRGRLVPDALVMAVLAERLAAPDVGGPGFVLDGYPRSIPQAVTLERLLAPERLTVAVELMVPEREALQRLRSRFVCTECGHPQSALPAVGTPERTGGSATCVRCDGELRRRTDDDPAVVAQRFAEFEQSTKPLLDWLDRRNRLVSVDADRPPDVVAHALLEALGPAVAAVGGPALDDRELTA
jgi:adenylate kinase